VDQLLNIMTRKRLLRMTPTIIGIGLLTALLIKWWYEFLKIHG
jgi:hypothetical protein